MMTDKITLELTLDELKLIDKYAVLNDETKSLFEKIKSAYPKPEMYHNNTGTIDDLEYKDLRYFRIDYGNNYVVWWEQTERHHAKMQIVADKETTEYLEFDYKNLAKSKPAEEVLDRLEDKYQKYGENSYFTDDVIDRVMEKWKENPPEFLKFEMGKTLEELITRWWCDVFGGINSNFTMEDAIDDLIDRIQLWLPKEQSAEGSQDTYAIVAVDTHNELLQKIKSKLRNKK